MIHLLRIRIGGSIFDLKTLISEMIPIIFIEMIMVLFYGC